VRKETAILAAGLAVLTLPNTALPVRAVEVNANPSHYREILPTLRAGDTMNLEPGKYPRLTIAGLNGSPDAWITIKEDISPAQGSSYPRLLEWAESHDSEKGLR